VNKVIKKVREGKQYLDRDKKTSGISKFQIPPLRYMLSS